MLLACWVIGTSYKIINNMTASGSEEINQETQVSNSGGQQTTAGIMADENDDKNPGEDPQDYHDDPGDRNEEEEEGMQARRKQLRLGGLLNHGLPLSSTSAAAGLFEVGGGRFSRAAAAAAAAPSGDPIMDGSYQDDFDADYQWFTESGFGGVGGTSGGGDNEGLMLESYPTPLCIGVGTDLEFDANMAHIDMEDFQSGDILLRLPTMCGSALEPLDGEAIASITGSILDQFNFETSISPQQSMDDPNNQSMDMSICKSENLFSPMAEQHEQLPLSTFSTDSLDTRGETILATCLNTNRNNYTIAFQGAELDESVSVSTYQTAFDEAGGATSGSAAAVPCEMTGTGTTTGSSDVVMDDVAHMTNWRQIKASKSNNSMNQNLQQHRQSDNNNGSNAGSRNTSTSNFGLGVIDTRALLTQSCPNPWYWHKAIAENSNHLRTPTVNYVKIFDVQNARMSSALNRTVGLHHHVNRKPVMGTNGNTIDSTTTTNVTNFARLNQNLVRGAPTTGGSSSSGSSKWLEESWNNNRNPNPNPFRIKTRLDRVRPTTTTQVADAVRTARSIEIQTSTIKLIPRKSRDQASVQASAATTIDDSKPTTPVFICYPKYALPDLSFLQGEEEGVFLLPQKYKLPQPQYQSQQQVRVQQGGGGGATSRRGRRPMSCNDIETIKQKGLSHVRDWPSLNFLLPQEYQNILQGIRGEEPTVSLHSTPIQRRPQEEALEEQQVIMRKKTPGGKPRPKAQRFSLSEPLRSPGSSHRLGMAEQFKRFSLQETVPEVAEITTEIAKNLQELEQLATTFGTEFFASATTTTSNASTVTLGIGSSASSSTMSNRPGAPQNTPKQAGSYIDFDNHFQTKAIIEEGAAKMVAHVAPMRSRGCSPSKHSRSHIDMAEKQCLIESVTSALHEIQQAWTPATADSRTRASRMVVGASYPNLLIMSESNGGKVVLDSLCPAIYSLLSDGLCPHLETIFGRVPNTVWRVIEASIQYGPTAQSLHELVLRINSEESLAEGPMKLNAFVCGLLNLGNLGSWMTFLRTKERLLRTHYEPEAFMYMCNTTTRYLYDTMLSTVHQMAKLPFQLDIFHETKLLHQSMIPQGNNRNPFASSAPASRKNSAKYSRAESAPSKPMANVVLRNKAGAAETARKATPGGGNTSRAPPRLLYANTLKKSQMKRSFSDERPKTTKTPNGKEKVVMPKSKTAQNIGQQGGKLARFPSKPRIQNHQPPPPTSPAEERPRRPAQRPKTIAVDADDATTPDSKDPDRFKRLQMQWELLSSEDQSRKNSPSPSPGGGAPSSGFGSPVSSKDAASLIGSKIPRPIMSPIRAPPIIGSRLPGKR